jgi:uncharacterized membrane protein
VKDKSADGSSSAGRENAEFIGVAERVTVRLEWPPLVSIGGPPYLPTMKPGARRAVRWLTAAFFVGVGFWHFANPAPFLHIMPPWLPAPAALVAISGAAEVAGGLGLLLPATRRAAAWGLLALLVAVYPANLHMAFNEVYLPDLPRMPWLLWARLPLQFLFAAAVLVSGGLWPRASSE